MRRRTPLCPRKRENALAFLGATCADARASSSGEKSASSESPMARAARMAGFHSPALRWGNYAWRAGGTHGDSGRQRPHARQGALFRDCLSMALPFAPGARRRAGALWAAPWPCLSRPGVQPFAAFLDECAFASGARFVVAAPRGLAFHVRDAAGRALRAFPVFLLFASWCPFFAAFLERCAFAPGARRGALCGPPP